MKCHECGEEFWVDLDGVAHHWSDENISGIDHDADDDHVPFSVEACTVAEDRIKFDL